VGPEVAPAAAGAAVDGAEPLEQNADKADEIVRVEGVVDEGLLET
jgi:hypothetical protein